MSQVNQTNNPTVEFIDKSITYAIENIEKKFKEHFEVAFKEMSNKHDIDVINSNYSKRSDGLLGLSRRKAQKFINELVEKTINNVEFNSFSSSNNMLENAFTDFMTTRLLRLGKDMSYSSIEDRIRVDKIGAEEEIKLARKSDINFEKKIKENTDKLAEIESYHKKVTPFDLIDTEISDMCELLKQRFLYLEKNHKKELFSDDRRTLEILSSEVAANLVIKMRRGDEGEHRFWNVITPSIYRISCIDDMKDSLRESIKRRVEYIKQPEQLAVIDLNVSKIRAQRIEKSGSEARAMALRGKKTAMTHLK